MYASSGVTLRDVRYLAESGVLEIEIAPDGDAQFTTQFMTPGEYLIACNEYCGVGHHMMAGKLIVVPQETWEPPNASRTPALERGEVAG